MFITIEPHGSKNFKTLLLTQLYVKYILHGGILGVYNFFLILCRFEYFWTQDHMGLEISKHYAYSFHLISAKLYENIAYHGEYRMLLFFPIKKSVAQKKIFMGINWKIVPVNVQYLENGWLYNYYYYYYYYYSETDESYFGNLGPRNRMHLWYAFYVWFFGFTLGSFGALYWCYWC